MAKIRRRSLEMKIEILEYLRDHQSARTSHIGRAVNLAYDMVMYHCEMLIKRKWVEESTKAVFPKAFGKRRKEYRALSLTPAGLEAIPKLKETVEFLDELI